MKTLHVCTEILAVAGVSGLAPGQEVLWRYDSTVKTDGIVSVDTIGDLDGDGCPEFIAGASLARRHLVLSGVHGEVLNMQWFPDPNPWQLHSAYGSYVAGVGDWTGDGVSDYAVNAHSYSGSTPGLFDIGLVRIFSGATHELVATFSDRIQGDSYSNQGIFGLGDITGDGWPELVVQTNSAHGVRQSIYSAPDGRWLRDQAGRGAFNYRSMPVFPDMDGDGIRDYLVTGGPVQDWRGRMNLISGASGDTIQSFIGPHVFSLLGVNSACAGDWDGDGVSDAAISGGLGLLSNGDPNTPTSVYIYSGATGELLREFRREEYRLPGDPFDSENFGYRVDSGKDVNGDGFPDLIVGAPSWSILATFQLHMGMLLVISGKTGSVLWQEIGWMDGMYVGESFMMLDDHDGDGFDDWLLVNRGKLGTQRGSVRRTV